MLNNLQIALIVSSDNEMRDRFSRLFKKIYVSFVLESDKITALMRILEMDIRIIIFDMESFPTNGIDFIRLIKKIKPRTPIITVTEEMSDEKYKELLDAGAFYCIIKKRKKDEIRRMVEGVLSVQRV
jgi:DNA-binding response OmpR family regulator